MPAEEVALFLERSIAWEEQGQYLYMTGDDMVLKRDPELAAIAKQFATDNELFVQEFAAAWTKLMNADRFKGPTGNECSPAAATSAGTAGRAAHAAPPAAVGAATRAASAHPAGQAAAGRVV